MSGDGPVPFSNIVQTLDRQAVPRRRLQAMAAGSQAPALYPVPRFFCVRQTLPPNLPARHTHTRRSLTGALAGHSPRGERERCDNGSRALQIQ
jgi:hypothetical protein